MPQEIFSPEKSPPRTTQSLGRVGSLMSAVGDFLMILSMAGAAGFATVWTVGKLLGFPDWLTYPSTL